MRITIRMLQKKEQKKKEKSEIRHMTQVLTENQMKSIKLFSESHPLLSSTIM